MVMVLLEHAYYLLTPLYLLLICDNHRTMELLYILTPFTTDNREITKERDGQKIQKILIKVVSRVFVIINRKSI